MTDTDAVPIEPGRVTQVPPDDVLVRRIKPPPHSMCVVDEGNGAVHVNRTAFIFQSDGISVYQRSLLTAHAMTPWDAVDAGEWPAEVTAAIIRKHFAVDCDPWPD